ncbi:MAG TPA: PAS domain S-box protein [Acidimicrobiales bacterium]|nr:PAS domain S-box protein [Acidimicrobiales bacterium]
MADVPGTEHLLPLDEAAEFLHVPVDTVTALVGAGYFRPRLRDDGPGIPLVDLKAFLARNADNGSGNLFDLEPNTDPQALLDALDGKSEDMARRAFEIFSAAFPETASWTLTEQARFVEQARARFEAILAVTSQGVAVDEALVADLLEVGAAAAMAGSPLPQLLVVLRISRDLVVQTAVELAEERGRHWGLALSLLLTRVLPAMDRLTDSLAQGYWNAVVQREEEHRQRHEHVTEHSSDGVYEVDLDGRLRYANRSLAAILGFERDELEGAHLTEVVVPTGSIAELSPLLTEPPAEGQVVELEIVRSDSRRRVIEVRVLPRHVEAEVVGFQGVVRDVTAAHELEAGRKDFLAIVTGDLRHPLNTILGLAATMETHADELPAERVRVMARAVRHQAERTARMADDLHDVSQLEARALELAVRPVDLAQVVSAALGSVEGADWVQVRVPAGVTVRADARRLEQAVANVVEFVVKGGEPPVVIDVGRHEGSDVELSITDDGPGLHDEDTLGLFAPVRSVGRERSPLALARGLLEAMEGSIRFQRAPSGASRFLLGLKTD